MANTLLYLAINFAGMYTKYLTDRGQRLAFIETHKAMEHKKDSEKEYQRTQKLLDSSKCDNFLKIKRYKMKGLPEPHHGCQVLGWFALTQISFFSKFDSRRFSVFQL